MSDTIYRNVEIKVKATYTPSEIALYKHNPFIEALPPVMTPERVSKLLTRRPAYDKSEREKPYYDRFEMVQSISHFFEPFPRHLELEATFSRMIRNGYMPRNPISSEWIKQLRSGFPNIDWGSGIPGYLPGIRSNAVGFSIIGNSGVGKSTSVESVLSLFPQVIVHSHYNGHIFNQTQLVWLKLDCPHDGSLKGLCLNFFQDIDHLMKTRYYKSNINRRTINELLPDMANLAANVGLGALVIDEIQRLKDVKKNEIPMQMLNFFVRLSDNIGVPVVLIGNFKALPLLTRELSIARRNEGQGGLLWWNEDNDEDWDRFIETLWKYQWTNVESPLTPELKNIIYEKSVGIVDLAIKLYQLAQWEVINSDDERITPKTIDFVARERLKLSHSILEAIRNRDIERLKKIPDLDISEEQLNKFFLQTKGKATLTGTLKTVRNQQKNLDYADETDDENPTYRIAKWLLDGGFEVAIARDAAVEAIKRCGPKQEFREVMESAYEIAKMLYSLKAPAPQLQSKIPMQSKPEMKKKAIISPDDLRSIVSQGKVKGLSGYESLKEAGFIKPIKEFFN